MEETIVKFDDLTPLWNIENRDIFLSELENISFTNIKSMDEPLWDGNVTKIESHRQILDGPYIEKYSLIEDENKNRWIVDGPLYFIGEKGNELGYIAECHLVRFYKIFDKNPNYPVHYTNIKKNVSIFNLEGKLIVKLILE